MARRLDKIEKEMGYCEIKLEKERRLRKQITFLRADIAALDRLVWQHATNGLRAPKVAGRSSLNGDTSRRPSREDFLAAGLLEIVQEEREILARELEELTGRLHAFAGFESKRSVLEEEKRNALKDLAPAHSSKMRRINEDFKKIERQWNGLTEDVINLNEGIFFLDRNLDYLRSCRTFLISARGNFDIESWVNGGYLSDLFRHSNIGRAKEMADGADRNLKMAQKELVCVSYVKIRSEPFLRVLEALLEALFEDIYVEGKLLRSLQVVEAALAGNIKLVEQVKQKRELLGARLEQTEKVRTQMFSRLGADRRSRLAG
jgi:hypothetical protein